MTVVLLLLLFGEKIKNNWIFISIFIFLAFSSKGQMVIFLITPLLLALIFGKISVKSFIKTALFTLILILLSLAPIFIRHGFRNWFDVYVMGIVSDRAVVSDLTQVAPIWWYGYWWMFSFRWGVLIFAPLVIYDTLNKKIDKNKLMVLMYIVVNFALMSLMKNKVWWYVMPLMPAISIYIYQSLVDLKKENKLKNLFLVFFVSAIPLFWSIEISLKRVVAYVFLVIVINLLILIKSFRQRYVSWWKFGLVFLCLAFVFYNKFPKPSASFPEVKKLLEDVDLSNSCLFVENMPYEGAMYYSKAGEINYWQGMTKTNCQNYLISPEVHSFETVKKVDRLRLYFISDDFPALEDIK